MASCADVAIPDNNGSPSLPQEMVDRILDNLHSSVPSLACCALVSRNWLPMTRYHLFRIPVLYQVSFGRSPKDNTKPFIELLGSPLSTFRQSIHGCVMNIEKTAILKRCVDALAAYAAITETLLVAQYIGSISFTTELQIPDKFPLIRNFVYSTYDTWPQDLSQLITSLPHLESLAIYARIREYDTSPHFLSIQGQKALPPLKTLRLRLFDPSKLLRWFLSLPGYTPQLETLDVVSFSSRPDGWGQLGELESFLAANHDTLKELKIGIAYQNITPHDQVISRLDERTLTNLRSLTLQTHDIDALCSTVGPYLQSNPSRLDVLTLNIVPLIALDGAPYREEYFRKKLEDTFDGRFFNKIGSFRILLSYAFAGTADYDDKNMVKIVSLSNDLLPTWSSRDALEIRISHDGNWQVDSLERINQKIWGTRFVPFSSKFARIGTL